MKKLKMLLSVIAVMLTIIMLYSCDNESDANPVLDDTELINAIASAANSQTISINALPSSAQSALENDYAESFVTTARLAPELGYEVDLRLSSGADVGEGSSAFFDLNGRELAARASEARDSNGRRRGRRAKGLRDCFEFVFPLSLTMPDGSTLTLESREDWPDVRAWYEANPDAEGRPEFVFPLEVNFGDSTLTINNTEELRRAKRACEVDRKRGRCFRLVFPVTFTMPDGTEITLESRDDWELINAWYEANPDVSERPDLVYPVDIVYRGDSTVTINSAEEMREARAMCEVDRDRDHCFSIEFPISFTMPDGTEITLESRDEWTLIKAWYDANPDAEERPDLVFPITITYENGNSVTINSEEELSRAKADCG